MEHVNNFWYLGLRLPLYRVIQEER